MLKFSHRVLLHCSILSFIVFYVIFPAVPSVGAGEDAVFVHDESLQYSCSDILVPYIKDAPANPVKPTQEDSQADIGFSLWEGYETRTMPEPLLTSVKDEIKKQFNKTIKNIDDALKTCYKAMDVASKKAKQADQDKAMDSAVDSLNKSYKKYLSAFPSELQSVAENALKSFAKANKTYASMKLSTQLTVGSIVLPPAPGFFNKLFSSGRDRSKEHKKALDRIPGFKKEQLISNPAVFNVYVPLMWGHNIYPFVNADERCSFSYNLPTDLNNAQFSEVCKKVREFIFNEVAKFNSDKILACNNQMKAVFCDPKKTMEHYNKLAAEKEPSLQKEQIALKAKFPAALDKVIQDALSAVPAYKGSPKLRSFGVARDDMSFNFAFSDSQLLINDHIPSCNPTIELWTRNLENLKTVVDSMPDQIGACAAATKDFSYSLRALVDSVTNLPSVTNARNAFTGNQAMTEYNTATKAAHQSFEEPVIKNKKFVCELEYFLAGIEKKAGKDKAIATQVNGIRAILEHVQKAILGLERMRLAVGETGTLFNSVQMYNGENLRTFFQRNASAIADEADRQSANSPSLDANVLRNAISAVIENISKLTL
ncbi:MAG: hypothetical protein HQM10_26030 [Candidatus Riflebacteria bacterium]|nr:hypothetical protein [Candidatus Riflebacteria bacterium]